MFLNVAQTAERDYKTLKGLSFGVGLPIEVRFGKYITDKWYIMGELTYHASLANETASLEPAVRVGYNFGRKIKK